MTFQIASLTEVPVLGLLFGIPYKIALEHAMDFYSRILTEGAPLEYALLETRRNLYKNFDRKPFWFSSILYM
jgi:hypothetical protein